MAVPRNVRDVAWYEFGPRPGEPGSAVLAAHVDLAGRGPGTFFRLRELDPGDTVEVDFADGSSRLFRVQARTVYSKADLPLDTIFAEGGASVLTLVTCGGGFDRSTGSYDSNVVVYAVPVAEAAATFAR
jgi:sortase (surface protein transpeptidase)